VPRSQRSVLASGHPLPAGSGRADPGVPPSAPLQGREGELAQLLARISRNDQEALAALYEVTHAVVYGQAVRFLGDPAAAEDLTLEVYTQVQRLASTYEPSRGVPSAWLLMLTRSRAIDSRRAQAARQRREVPLQMAMGLPSPELDPQEWSAAAEWRCRVQAALTALHPAQREVIDIAYYGGLSHREIAARLGQPLGTVKTRLRTGLRVLRDVLRPLGVEECR
jgi:RNA polymerase sigma-70 factor, ECF subfamily